MELNKIIIDYFNSSSLVFLKTIPINELTFDERAELMCKYGCKNYNRKFSCPPYSLALKKTILNKNFSWVLLFATSIKIDEKMSRWKLKNINHVQECEIQRICLDINNIFINRNINHYVLSGGACKRCKPCSATNKKLCSKPTMKQTSMEAIGIDCQITMHNAGFDFSMPNIGSINRCGCVITNSNEISNISEIKQESFQKFRKPDLKDVIELKNLLINEYSNYFEQIKIVSIEELVTKNNYCNNTCLHFNNNYSCPPYSNSINSKLWNHAIIWKWRDNNSKKYTYNNALKIIHKAFFSKGFYFSLSLRDSFCNECNVCGFSNKSNLLCINRTLLAPSMQALGINPNQFGNDQYGIELI